MAAPIFDAEGQPAPATVAFLAGQFADVLREWLTEAQWRQMRRLNTSPDYAESCASQDFCDANMAMDEAWKRAFGREPNVVGEGPEVERECRLWNEAWSSAKASSLTELKDGTS